MNIEELSVIGIGNTATVYEWQDHRVLKLFYEGYPQSAVKLEYRNARAISHMTFDKPNAYEMVMVQERHGIVYDRVDGTTLEAWLLSEMDIVKGAWILADFHKKILEHTHDDLPSYKEFLRYMIGQGEAESAKVLFDKIQELPEVNHLCHGDYHPANIFMVDDQPVVIDFMNVCRGPKEYDVARTYYLIAYTPVAKDIEDQDLMMKLKLELANMYLSNMGMTYEAIEMYLNIIREARKIECPDENPLS